VKLFRLARQPAELTSPAPRDDYDNRSISEADRPVMFAMSDNLKPFDFIVRAISALPLASPSANPFSMSRSNIGRVIVQILLMRVIKRTHLFVLVKLFILFISPFGYRIV
jgi:hypothetical protein